MAWRKLILAAVLVPLAPGLAGALAVAGRPARPAVTWSLQRRGLGFYDWRPRLALGPSGEAWMGGSVLPGAAGGLLYRWLAGEWTPWRTAPEGAARTFVLDTDSSGALWLAAYSATDKSTYGGLRVRRYDGRRWHEEIVRPGIWPQAIDMVAPDEGWIGGNHAKLLHLAKGRWKLEALPLPEAEREEHNVLALKMRSPDEGWLVGVGGLVARYRHDRWSIVPVPDWMRPKILHDLDAPGDGSLWVVGGGGLIARYDGATWRQLATPRDFNLYGLDMLSADDGWAVGEYGTVLRWNGRAWRQQASPTLSDLYAVAMTASDQGWILANDAVFHAASGPRLLLRDVAPRSRFPMARQPGRWVAAADADGDGDLDLFVMEPTSIHLFENLEGKGFVEAASLPPPPPGLLRASVWGDVDEDGDLDLLVLGRNPGAVWLLRNQGGLRFAAPERLAREPVDGIDSAALVDLDRDGRLDLYLARSSGPQRLPDFVFHNLGLGRFELSQTDTGRRGIEMLTLWGDLDGDLDLDAVLPGNGGHEVSLLRNEGGRLRDATAGSGLDVPLGRGRMFQGGLLDLDRDGDLDLLLLGDRLYTFLNDGKAHFRRDDVLFEPVANNPAVASSLSGFGDLDHDGYPEVLLQTVDDGQRKVYLFSRGRDGHYRDVAPRFGLADLAGNAAVLADWDGDGDLDLFVAGEEGGSLLENLHNDSNFLTLRVAGDRGNRWAVGAWARLWEAGHLGERAFLRGSQQAGVGFNPAGAPAPGVLHFGLDGRRRYDVEVVFPSGRRVVLRDVRPGQALEIRESPPVLRQAILFWQWGRRAWLAADLRREGAKLALAVLALAVWRALAGASGARRLARRWSLSAGLLVVYLLTAGCLAPDGRLAAHGLQLLGFAGGLGLLTLADRRVAGWRSRHYLGPYHLLEKLGEGGMGVVYRARHGPSRRTVALKVLHPRMIEQEEHRLRFLREGRILAGLEHPSIVRVFAAGEAEGRGYISMELLAGESLRRFVRRRGPLSPDDARAVLLAAGDALSYVHARGIVHRDVKSDNLFLLAPEDLELRSRVRLMDFGLARASDTNTLTDRRALLGTLAYMPPEQLRGQALDARSDLYSLGVVAYEALTGRLPFADGDEGSLLASIHAGRRTPLRRLRPEIPEDLASLVERMLERDPRDRPASAADVVAALQSAGDQSAAATSGRAEAPWRERFERAQTCLRDGRATEAQILALEGLAELKALLLAVDPDRREEVCRTPDVAAALELTRRLIP